MKKYAGRYQPSDPRFSKRRYGSMSSLPSSSVSSRPIRDKRRGHDERKKVRDIRGINKRFQRLESHVVTLARSVAHLSSEMRTQHIMIQEMENIRGEIAALRTQTNMLNVRSQSASRAINSSKDLPNLANPTRVKKLTKFFGDEPPLLRLFLRKLGYEVSYFSVATKKLKTHLPLSLLFHASRIMVYVVCMAGEVTLIIIITIIVTDIFFMDELFHLSKFF